MGPVRESLCVAVRGDPDEGDRRQRSAQWIQRPCREEEHHHRAEQRERQGEERVRQLDEVDEADEQALTREGLALRRGFCLHCTTRWGLSRCVVVPSPSLPEALSPQQ